MKYASDRSVVQTATTPLAAESSGHRMSVSEISHARIASSSPCPSHKATSLVPQGMTHENGCRA